jgi:hypothetical protein
VCVSMSVCVSVFACKIERKREGGSCARALAKRCTSERGVREDDYKSFEGLT